MKICPWNFTHKKATIKKIFVIKTFKCFWSMEFTSYDLKILFIYTLCSDNVDDNEFFRLKNVFGLNVFLIIWQQ
jgi:hypothetical protein